MLLTNHQIPEADVGVGSISIQSPVSSMQRKCLPERRSTSVINMFITNINPHTTRHDKSRFKSILLDDQITVIGNEINCSNIKICKYLVSNVTHVSYFHPLKVVGRGSETQL